MCPALADLPRPTRLCPTRQIPRISTGSPTYGITHCVTLIRRGICYVKVRLVAAEVARRQVAVRLAAQGLRRLHGRLRRQCMVRLPGRQVEAEEEVEVLLEEIANKTAPACGRTGIQPKQGWIYFRIGSTNVAVPRVSMDPMLQ